MKSDYRIIFDRVNAVAAVIGLGVALIDWRMFPVFLIAWVLGAFAGIAHRMATEEEEKHERNSN